MSRASIGSAGTKVTFSLASGVMPDGVKLNENTGELYGVPTRTGKFTFTIRASFNTAGIADSEQEYTIEVAENTDANVESENEHTILNRVQMMGDENDDWNGEFHDQVFRIDHTYAEFAKFFIDGELLQEGSDYDSEEGSTKITIRSKTFERYGNGTHTIAAEFRRLSDNVMTKSAQNYAANVKTKVNPGSGVTQPQKPATSRQENVQFADVKVTDWFYEDVMWAAGEGHMVGVSAARFAPRQTTTQAMVVTILARIAKADLNAYARAGQTQWYAAAANWVAQLGMIDINTFAPNAPIRRGDLAVMLLKFFEGTGVSYEIPRDNEKTAFMDAAEMTAAEEQAFQCCFRAKIFLGNGRNDMRPQSYTTRAQLAALIRRVAAYAASKG